MANVSQNNKENDRHNNTTGKEYWGPGRGRADVVSVEEAWALNEQSAAHSTKEGNREPDK